jgi:hypothetical protein
MVKRSGKARFKERPWAELIPKIEPLVYQVHAGKALGTAFVVSVTGPTDGGATTPGYVRDFGRILPT